LIILSLVGCLLSETLSANLSEDTARSPLSTKYRSAKRMTKTKTSMEIRNDKALMTRINKEIRKSTSRILRQELVRKNSIVSESDVLENQIRENPLPKPMHKLASKFIGYNCGSMGSNSNGNGLAIIQADPYDCSGYYYCAWGIYKPSQCTWPLLWNDEIKACDWYFNVDCGSRPFQKAAE